MTEEHVIIIAIILCVIAAWMLNTYWFRQLATETKSEFNNSRTIFYTEKPQEDGTMICYLHNKSKLKESEVIWRLSPNGLSVSEDGGRTYKATIPKDDENIWIRVGNLKKSEE